MVKIKCPYCGREYFPSEIYYPKDFFGNPEDIVRDLETGEILSCSGTGMDTHEEYICDNCGKTFVVDATIDFKVSTYEIHDFDEEYSMPLFVKERITLKEE